MTKCPGCGYKLQSEDTNKLGYIPNDTQNKAVYCERCFKIIHYNSALVVNNPKDTKKTIDEVNKKGKLAFFLVDFLNINSETINVFNQIKINKVLVISKSDIIPRSIREHKIINWLQRNYKIDSEIILVSTKLSDNLSRIPNIIKKYLVEEAYILGFTNAGKSSMINRIYELYQNKKSLIAISSLPNTTIDFIKIKINDNFTLIDSPGFILDGPLYDDLTLVKQSNPKSFIKPITYQMKEDMSIIFNHIIRVKYDSKDKNSMTSYMSNKMDIERVFEDNTILKDKDSKKFKVKEDSDIVIKGIGFINVKKDCNITIYSDYLPLIEIRKSIFEE